MSIADNIYATPSRVILTFEYMNSLGEKGAKQNDIIAQLEVGGLKKGGDSMIRTVIKELKKMKLLEGEGEEIKLKKELLNQSSTSKELREDLYKVLINKLTDKKEAKESIQEDVPFYIALILSLDPFKPIKLGSEEFFIIRDAQLKEMFEPLKSSKVVNKNQVSNLGFWMHYLGFVSKGFSQRKKDDKPLCIFPDPTEAIVKILPSIFTSKNKLHVEDFQNLLGECLPVLEGGDVRKIIENKTNDENRRGRKYFSKSTSLALKRLILRGLIKIDSASDHKIHWYLDLGKDQHERVSIIEYKGINA